MLTQLFYFLIPINPLQVLTGYLLAGSLVGPGGLNVISEMVQVCCSCQLNVLVCISDAFALLAGSLVVLLWYPNMSLFSISIEINGFCDLIAMVFFFSESLELKSPRELPSITI